jgi:hypothetical protein
MEKQEKIKNAHWYKRVLNRICLDERLTPNRRLLAAILGMHMDAISREDRMLYTAILLGEFVSRNGLKIYDSADQKFGPNERTNIELAADAAIKDVFSSLFSGDAFNGENDAATV